MARCENEILDGLMEIINGYHGKDYYIMGEIPQNKLSASTAFHGVDPRDTVLVLLDSTIMGSAENGMSITLKGIYWKNMWATKTRKNSYTWEDLTKLYDRISVKGGNLIFEPGVEFYVPANYKEASLVNLIKALTQFYIDSKKDYESEAISTTSPEPRSDPLEPSKLLSATPNTTLLLRITSQTRLVDDMRFVVTLNVSTSLLMPDFHLSDSLVDGDRVVQQHGNDHQANISTT